MVTVTGAPRNCPPHPHFTICSRERVHKLAGRRRRKQPARDRHTEPITKADSDAVQRVTVWPAPAGLSAAIESVGLEADSQVGTENGLGNERGGQVQVFASVSGWGHMLGGSRDRAGDKQHVDRPAGAA